MTLHAGQSSARARRAKIQAVQDRKLATFVDDLIWEQVVSQAADEPTPAWVRPTILLGGLLVTLAWLGAIAHGCS
jgi:hypothetical protein